MPAIVVTLWHLLNTPLGVSLTAGALAWVLQKLGVIGDSRLKKILSMAALIAQALPQAKWTDFVEALINEMTAHGMGLPSGPEMLKIRQAWDALGGNDVTPARVARTMVNGSKVNLITTKKE